eukprot:41549_1
MTEPCTDTTNTTNLQDKKKKQWEWVRSAKKGLSRASKQMAKGAVKAKQAAAEKIGKVPVSEEDPQIISALERLKITKTEIYAISDLSRKLYESRVNGSTIHLGDLADKLRSTKATQKDPFATYVKQMGVHLSHLETLQSQHLERMESELVAPLERFRDVDVEDVQTFKLKYKRGKTQYDITAHKLTKAKESNDTAKIFSAQQQKDADCTQLNQLRNDLKRGVNNLEQRKHVHLLQSIEQYWASYASFVNAQNNIFTQNMIEKENAAAAPIQNDDSDDIMTFLSNMTNEGMPPPEATDDWTQIEDVHEDTNPFGSPTDGNDNALTDENDTNNPFGSLTDNNDDNTPVDDYSSNPFDENPFE